jgi:hypothetical protein
MRPCAPSGLFNYQRTKKMLVGAVGIEPTTFGLKGRCSTTELRPYIVYNQFVNETDFTT